jgi:hypothetical protein
MPGHLRKVAATFVVTAGLLALTANVAFANVGLPYTFHITCISGYGNGVQTPFLLDEYTRADLRQAKPVGEPGCRRRTCPQR